MDHATNLGGASTKKKRHRSLRRHLRSCGVSVPDALKRERDPSLPPKKKPKRDYRRPNRHAANKAKRLAMKDQPKVEGSKSPVVSDQKTTEETAEESADEAAEETIEETAEGLKDYTPYYESAKGVLEEEETAIVWDKFDPLGLLD